MKKEKYTGLRKGVTLIELSIVLVIAGILAIGVFVVAPKLMTGGKADNTVNSFGAINSAMESVKASNGGAYPAQAAAATFAAGPAALYNELGNAAGTRDLAGWTYRCPAGGGQTITVVTSDLEDAQVQQSAITKINGRFAPWAAVASGTTGLTITKANVTCQ